MQECANAPKVVMSAEEAISGKSRNAENQPD